MKALKTFDLNAAFDATDAATMKKLEREAAKADSHAFYVLLDKATKKIGFGAIRIDGTWYPVVEGKAQRKEWEGHTYSTGACSVAYSQRGAAKVSSDIEAL